MFRRYKKSSKKPLFLFFFKMTWKMVKFHDMMKQLHLWILSQHEFKGRTWENSLCMPVYTWKTYTRTNSVCLNVLLCVPVLFFSIPKSGEKSIIWYKAICSASFAFRYSLSISICFICTIFIIQKIYTFFFVCEWNSFHFESARTKIYEKKSGKRYRPFKF